MRPAARRPCVLSPELLCLTQVGATPELVETPRCTVRASGVEAHACWAFSGLRLRLTPAFPSRQVDPDFARVVQAQPEEHRATMPRGPDPKWRFFWRVGPRPAAGSTRYAELNAAPVIPKARSLCYFSRAFAAANALRCRDWQAFPQWAEVMEAWGCHMMNAVTSVAEMAALG